MFNGLIDLLIGGPCGFCGHRTQSDHAASLADNLEKHGVPVGETPRPSRVCPGCYSRNKRATCAVTKLPFPQWQDRLATFKRRTDDHLAPFHRLSALKGHLSPAGLIDVEREYANFLRALEAWQGHSKGSFLPGFATVERIGHVRTDHAQDSIRAIEQRLRVLTVQQGGNAFVEFYWNKHLDFHEERYVAGYGPKGNPYFRTRTDKIVSFTGHAIAIRVKRSDRQDDRRQHAPDEKSGSHESMEQRITRLRAVLGLAASFTHGELVSAYRTRMKEYHPDRVHGLGAELRVLAERKTKEINDAYAALLQKFS